MMLAQRRMWEAAKVLSGYAEKQVRQAVFSLQGFDLSPMEIREPKMYPVPRDLNRLDMIVGHVTGVPGGFGVSKKLVRKWTEKLWAPDRSVPLGLLGQLNAAGLIQCMRGGVYRVRAEDIDALARRLALWDRYHGSVPYHQIGAANGDNLANRQLSEVTWHGSLGNDGVGWALDVGGKQILDEWHVQTGQSSLVRLCNRVLAVSVKAREQGIVYAPHRSFSPNRRGDTHKEVHNKVVLPVVARVPQLRVDYTLFRGKGLPIPRKWDPSALYDGKGRKL